MSISCIRCESVLGERNFREPAPCPSCGVVTQVELFPALLRPATAPVVSAAVLEGESSCFYHTTRRAVIPCAICGRFLCALCDLEVGGEHICPACLKAAPAQAKLPQLERSRTLYDNMAAGTALLGILLGPVALFTGPVAVFIALRHWRTTGSLLPRSRLNYYLAILLGVAGFAFWIYLIRQIRF